MNTQLRQLFHKIFLVFLLLAFLSTIPLPFMPQDTDAMQPFLRLGTVSIIILAYTSLGYCCLLPMDKPGLRGVSVAGVIICLLSLCYSLYHSIIIDFSFYGWSLEGMMGETKLYATFAVFSLASAVCCVLLRINVRTTLVRKIRGISLIAILTVAVIVLLTLVATETNEVVLRFTMLAYIVAIFGTAITLYLHELSRGEIDDMPEDDVQENPYEAKENPAADF